jgi:hypothetical protein
MVDRPRVELIQTISGPIWRVCGLGYCTEHRQRWQAEVLFECLLVAKGLASGHEQTAHGGSGDG